MAMPQHHKTAKRHLTKTEFKLFQNSLPKNISGMNERRVKSAHKNTQDLIKKYRKGLKNASESKQEKIHMRLQNLEQTLDRYSRNLKHITADSEAEGRRSITGQPKLRLRGAGGTRQQQVYAERNNIFPMRHEEPHSIERPVKAKSKSKPKSKSRTATPKRKRTH